MKYQGCFDISSKLTTSISRKVKQEKEKHLPISVTNRKMKNSSLSKCSHDLSFNYRNLDYNRPIEKEQSKTVLVLDRFKISLKFAGFHECCEVTISHLDRPQRYPKKRVCDACTSLAYAGVPGAGRGSDYRFSHARSHSLLNWPPPLFCPYFVDSPPGVAPTPFISLHQVYQPPFRPHFHSPCPGREAQNFFALRYTPNCDRSTQKQKANRELLSLLAQSVEHLLKCNRQGVAKMNDLK